MHPTSEDYMIVVGSLLEVILLVYLKKSELVLFTIRSTPSCDLVKRQVGPQ